MSEVFGLKAADGERWLLFEIVKLPLHLVHRMVQSASKFFKHSPKIHCARIQVLLHLSKELLLLSKLNFNFILLGIKGFFESHLVQHALALLEVCDEFVKYQKRFLEFKSHHVLEYTSLVGLVSVLFE